MILSRRSLGFIVAALLVSPAFAKSGADSVDGYIIRHTDKGIVKIPRNQNFKFGASDVDGQAQSPSQTVLGKRPPARRANLIPERQSFRNEFLNTVGYQER